MNKTIKPTRLKLKTAWPHIITLGLLLTVALGLGAALAVDSPSSQLYAGQAAADKPLRLHILAHSDAEFDQQVKLELRDWLVGYLQSELAPCTDKQQAMQRLQDCLPLIERLCNTRLQQLGLDYRARACLETADFPAIDYNGQVYAAGDYDALRIVLGAGQGHNWWCVLFPPLCFVDLAAAVDPTAVVPAMSEDDAQLTQVATGYSYRLGWKLGELWQQ